MEKGEVVLRFFIPANQETTKAIHPGMCPFHHPPTSFEAGFPFERLRLFPTRPDMGGEAEVVKDVAHLLVIVSLVQAHPLRLLLRWLRTVDDDALDCRAC